MISACAVNTLVSYQYPPSGRVRFCCSSHNTLGISPSRARLRPPGLSQTLTRRDLKKKNLLQIGGISWEFRDRFRTPGLDSESVQKSVCTRFMRFLCKFLYKESLLMSLDFYGIFWAWLNVNQHWEFFRSASATGAFLHNFTLVVLSICLFICLFV